MSNEITTKSQQEEAKEMNRRVERACKEAGWTLLKNVPGHIEAETDIHGIQWNVNWKHRAVLATSSIATVDLYGVMTNINPHTSTVYHFMMAFSECIHEVMAEHAGLTGNETITVASVDDLDPTDWMEALDADSKEEFENHFNITLEGGALAFLEAIFADDVITVTNADDVDSYIDFDSLWCRDEELIPANGQVHEGLHARITRDIEETNHVKLVGDALIEFNALMKSSYADIAGAYDPEEHPTTDPEDVNDMDWKIPGVTDDIAYDAEKLRVMFEELNNVYLEGDALEHFTEEVKRGYFSSKAWGTNGTVTLTIDPETGAETLDYFGVIYTGEALEEFRWQNTARETLECWDRASWHYYEGLPCEHNMILALEDVPYDKFDFLEDYAWNTLTSCWKAMRAYIAQGNFSDDPKLGEAKMREVWEWLDGWHKYHNASNASKD